MGLYFPYMEERAANIVLGVTGPGDKFTIKWMGIKFRLQIKLISTEKLIKISREVCKIRDIYDDDETFFKALMKNGTDAKFICNAIAISTGTPFVKIISKAISKLPLKDVNTLFKIVQSRSDADVFFYIIASAKKLNLMKKAKEE
jgi:hypothetical protein